jgi:hypothetical protein
VFSTGYDSDALPERFADVRLLGKPSLPEKVLAALAERITQLAA